MNGLNSSHQVVTHLFPARCLCAYARCPQISSIQDTISLRSSVQLKSTAESNGISLHRQAARDDDESSFSSLFPLCQGKFGRRGIVFRSQYKLRSDPPPCVLGQRVARLGLNDGATAFRCTVKQQEMMTNHLFPPFFLYVKENLVEGQCSVKSRGPILCVTSSEKSLCLC